MAVSEEIESSGDVIKLDRREDGRYAVKRHS